MKHPVLTRAFAVVLIIMSLILIAASSYGIIRAKADYSESLEDISLMQSRLEEFNALTGKLIGKADYATRSAKYEEQLDEYESDAAQFHTDLAVDTATKAGIKETRKTLVDMSGMILYYSESAQSTINQLDAKSAEAESGKTQAEQGLAAIENYPDEYPIPESYQAQFQGATTFGEAKAMLRSAIAQADAGINQISSVKSSILSGIGSGWDGINDAVFMLNNKEKELNEDYDGLAAEKSRLEAEAAGLKAIEAQLAELKSDELRLDALEGLLKSGSGINEDFESGTELSSAAAAEIQSLKESSYRTYVCKLALNIIGIAAAVFAFLGLPAAFEKTGSRFALIFPPVMFTVLSMAVLWLNIYITTDVSYAALMSAVFGLVQIIIVISDRQKHISS